MVVAEQDAPRARQIAVEFDRRAAAAAQENAEAEENQPEPTLPRSTVREPAADWPVCPQCGARRMTPLSGLRDGRYAVSLGRHGFQRPVGAARGTALDLSLWPRRLHAGRATSQEPASEPQQPGVPPQRMLICTTCDEPFVPEYPRRCEWCGHTFADGYEVDVAADEQGEGFLGGKGHFGHSLHGHDGSEYPSLLGQGCCGRSDRPGYLGAASS